MSEYPPDVVIRSALALFPVGHGQAEPLTRTVLAALAEHGMTVVPAEDASRCFRLDHDGRLGDAEQRAEQAEAANVRVREVCDKGVRVVTRGDGTDEKSAWWYAVDVREVEAALDGPGAVSEEQTGSSNE